MRGIWILAVWTAAGGCGAPEEPEVEQDPHWSVGVSLPVPLSQFGAAVYRGAIYVAGGLTDGGSVAAVFRYASGANEWERVADLPTFRRETHLLVASDSLFAAGGFNVPPNNVLFEDQRMWVYDVEGDAWLERPSLPDGRHDPAMVSTGDQIILVSGGLGSMDHGGLTPGDTAAIYDVRTGEWRYSSSAMSVARSSAMAALIQGKIYIFGGGRATDGALADVIEVYDVASDTWSSLDATFDAQNVYTMAPAMLGDEVHFLGGFVPVPGAPHLDQHLVFNVMSGDWTRAAELPTARGSASAVMLDGQIIVMGGFRWSQALPDAITDTVEVYTPVGPGARSAQE